MQSSVLLGILSIFALSLWSFSSVRSTRKYIRPLPQFVQGATLDYSIETRTTANEHTTTPIVNAEGASRYQQSTRLVLRLDVLGVQPGPPSSTSSIRLGATFEQARADSQVDAYAPEAAALDDAIEKLEGQSVEFTWGPQNNVTSVKRLDQVAPNRDVAGRVLAWLRVLCSPVDLPENGIQIGQKWTTERGLTELPLTGVVWRNDSTYLRDEPCAASSGAESRAASPASQGDCAVLLTRFEIFRRGSERSETTPEDYLRNGLRTSGKWTGAGQSLDAISLASGFLVSSTQSGTQDMDYEIWSASSGSRIHHLGQTTTQTQITLLPSQLPPVRP
jgi:hypothetical protein